MRIVARVILLATFCLAAAAVAGPPSSPRSRAPGGEPPADSAGVVRVRALPASQEAAPGGRVVFAVAYEIDPGWHLYAHGDSVFIGIDLKGLDKAPLDSMIVIYPEGGPGVFFGEKVRLLAGAGRVEISGRLAADADLPLRLDLEFEAQACDDAICLAPARLPAVVNLTRAAGPPSERED